MKDILGRFKDLQFFTGESMDCEGKYHRFQNDNLFKNVFVFLGMIAMMEYRDVDGVSTPILMCFKHGLDEEKF